MRSPKDMDVVQIEITNACVRSCSNCTRFCGHHRKPFFMDFETFKKAVESMDGFMHTVGVMGGEPTLHPEFGRFCDYFREHYEQSRQTNVFTEPVADFPAHIDGANLRLKTDRIRGLFTSLGMTYLRHFEKIQDTFGFQCLNDHQNPSLHGALLMTRRELGIPDAEWVELRDACWVQNLWSASITPKGAFFCEIAAALDMLLDGPGGWPIEPGWWRRQPADFADQLHWCELCSAALPVPKRDAREETDDVSPEWLGRLLAIGGVKSKNGCVAVFDPCGYDPARYTVTNHHRPYHADRGLRMAKENRTIYPEPILTVFLSPDGMAPAASSFHAVMREVSGEGRQAYAELTASLPRDRRAWVLLCRDRAPAEEFLDTLSGLVFNPGCLYQGEGWQFFNPCAAVLADGGDLLDLEVAYPAEKIVRLATTSENGAEIRITI